MVCYRAGDEPEGLSLQESRVRLGAAVSLTASLASVACWFPGNGCYFMTMFSLVKYVRLSSAFYQQFLLLFILVSICCYHRFRFQLFRQVCKSSPAFQLWSCLLVCTIAFEGHAIASYKCIGLYPIASWVLLGSTCQPRTSHSYGYIIYCLPPMIIHNRVAIAFTHF